MSRIFFVLQQSHLFSCWFGHNAFDTESNLKNIYLFVKIVLVFSQIHLPLTDVKYVLYKTCMKLSEVVVKYYNITKFYQILMKNKEVFLNNTFNGWSVRQEQVNPALFLFKNESFMFDEHAKYNNQETYLINDNDIWKWKTNQKSMWVFILLQK